MPDPNPASPASPDASKPDLTNYVPKSDYEKAITAKEKELSSLKSKADEQALALLDPEYIEWKEGKSKAASPAKPSATPDTEARFKKIEESFNAIARALSDAEARQELREVESRFSDWNDHLPEIKAFYTKNPDSTASYEQVYRIVKDLKRESKEKEDAAKDPKKAKPAQAGTEKPSGAAPARVLEQKEFKTQAEADVATLQALKEQFPDLGNTI